MFSSSAATYGAPETALVEEKSHLVPESPYGETKVVGEWLAKDAGAAYGVRSVCLRYFNVAGAATPELGDPEAFNLIPMVFERLTKGERPRIFGDDYPTPDGTCIRDYIHVADIASAHLAAARYLDGDGESLSLNIGRGQGSSVREVIDMIGEVTGLDVTPDVVARRPGDPPRTVASADAIRHYLGWDARYDLREMVELGLGRLDAAAPRGRRPAAGALTCSRRTLQQRRRPSPPWRSAPERGTCAGRPARRPPPGSRGSPWSSRR